MQTALTFVVWGSLLALLVLIYFWPTVNAIQRGHEASFGIGLLNLVAGWTLVGWVVALVWSYGR